MHPEGAALPRAEPGGILGCEGPARPLPWHLTSQSELLLQLPQNPALGDRIPPALWGPRALLVSPSSLQWGQGQFDSSAWII